MSKEKYFVSEKVYNIQGEDIRVTRINNDVNGNPRYVVHFLDLGIELEDYGKIPGLKKYRAKWYGGGYVFSSYNVEDSLSWLKDYVKEYYNKQEVI